MQIYNTEKLISKFFQTYMITHKCLVTKWVVSMISLRRFELSTAITAFSTLDEHLIGHHAKVNATAGTRIFFLKLLETLTFLLGVTRLHECPDCDTKHDNQSSTIKIFERVAASL